MRMAALVALTMVAATTGSCATHHDAGRYGLDRARGDLSYVGQDYDRLGNGCDAFAGGGADLLDPWLACTEEGRDFIRSGFGPEEDQVIDVALADEANIWFRRHADADRDMRLTDPEIRAALVNISRDHALLPN